ncbi:hypothetical protein J2Z21_000694 [Streptomyces griseochromogenes]|uniref:Uncharacterized protein n=1 Tax=Streptomyces griseochromogenes TaxID=68214 RepID=A0ABS4LK59_9ACTN|nr:hypothetical protein [Streptomyces griseochromogenes]
MPFPAAGTPAEPVAHGFDRLDGGCLHLGVLQLTRYGPGAEAVIALAPRPRR